MNYVINKKTNQKIYKAEPLNEEILFDGGVMITETDLSGIITYANKKFREMTGFSKEELVGSPHSINRHPDMPKGAFRAMWKTIKSGDIWRGYVKNMRKDGNYYWVLVYIQPKVDQTDSVIGYVAGRKIASREAIEEARKTYSELRADEHIDHHYFLCNHAEIQNTIYPLRLGNSL